MQRSNGFTIIELLVVIAIMAILATLAIPSYLDFFEKGRVRGAAEMVYEHLMFAKTQAIKRSKPIVVEFSPDGTDLWGIGLTDKTSCVPNGSDAANLCTISDYNNDGDATDATDAVAMFFTDADFQGVVVTQNFTDDSSGFDPVRGTVLDGSNGAGEIVLKSTNDQYEVRISVSEAGSISICSPITSPTTRKVIGYPDC